MRFLNKKNTSTKSVNEFGNNKKHIMLFLLNIGSYLRNFNIHRRLIVFFLLLSLVPLMVIGVLSYNKSRNAIEDKIKTYSIQVNDQVSSNISIDMKKYTNYFNEIAISEVVQRENGLEKVNIMDDVEKFNYSNEIGNYISKMILSENDIADFRIIPADFSTDDGIPFINAPIGTGMTWSKDVVNNLIKISSTGDSAENIWTVENFDNNVKYVILSKQIKSMSTLKPIGYIFCALSEDHFSKIYSGVDIGNGAEIFIFNSKGTVVSSRNSKIEIGKVYEDASLIENIKSNMKKEKKYYLDRNALITFSPIQNTDWYLVSSIPLSFLNKETNEIGIFLLIIAAICLVIAIFLSVVVSLGISAPLRYLVEAMTEAKKGNLAIRLKDKGKDEIFNVMTNFNEMLGNIRVLVSKAHNLTGNVSDSSKKIAESTEWYRNSSEQISESIQQIAMGASEQANEISNSAEYMNKLSSDINVVGSDIKSIFDVVGETKKLSEDSVYIIKDFKDKTLETSSVSQNIVNQINDLFNSMKEIKKIVKVIEGIAEQTNLLSLNAALEAARAGNAGRGFAVVADEVKKLADQSKSSSKTISDILGNIQKKTELTVNLINSSGAIVKHQVEAITKTDNVFKTIFNSMESISARMEGIEESISKIISLKDKTLDAMHTISAVSQEAAATSEEVASGTEEQILKISELSTLTKELSAMSIELDHSVRAFKV